MSVPIHPLKIRTLGSFSVADRGRPICFPGLKDRALFAYLAVLKNQAHHRDRLADLLWSEQEEKKARHSLNQSLYVIRRLIPEVIHSDIHTIRLDPARVSTDVDTLLLAIRRHDVMPHVDLLQGEFLAELNVRNAPEFEEWRADFGRHVLTRTEKAILHELEETPPSEREKIQLRLPLTLGMVATNTQVISESDHDPKHQSLQRSIELPLVGRHSQLMLLEQRWRLAISQSTQSIVVVGPAGAGKTRLVSDFIESTNRHTRRVIRARCFQSERRIGFAPMIDILTREFTDADYAGLDRLWIAALGQLIPSLQNASSPPTLSANGSKTRIFEAVLRLLEQSSKVSPILLFVDDIQWADKSSIACLSYVARRSQKARLMIIATMRGGAKGPLPEPIAEWSAIRLSNLSEVDITLLVRQLQGAPSPRSAQRLYQLTAGNPYLVAELVRSGSVDPPRRAAMKRLRATNKNIDAVIAPMFRRLPAGAKETVSVLAVLGRPAGLGLLKRMLPGLNIPRAVDHLASRGIVTAATTKVFFQHDLVREFAYDRIPTLRRNELHRCAATVLNMSGKWPGEVAEHYYRARLRRQTHKHALEAVKDADQRHATDEGIAFLKLALKSSPAMNLRLYLDLANRLCSSHRMLECRSLLAHLPRTTRQTTDDLIKAQLLDLEAAYGLGAIEGIELRSKLQDLSASGACDDPQLGMQILRLQIRSAYHDGDALAITRLLSEAERARMPSGLEALAHSVRVHSLINSAVEAEHRAGEIWKAAEALCDNELRIRIKLLVGVVSYEVGKLVQAEALHWELLREVERLGAISQYPVAAVNTHMLLVEQGKYEDAVKLAAEVRTRVSAIDPVQYLAPLSANEACMYYELGDFDRAQVAARDATRRAAKTRAVWIEIGCVGISGLIAQAQGRLSDANASADIADRIIVDFGQRVADVSHAEILIARLSTQHAGREAALRRLRTAVNEYANRDVVCRLRMECELARQMKDQDRAAARSMANRVFREASNINARPIAEKADALLLRL